MVKIVISHPTQKIRKIVHVDMDAFYVSVEQKDDPSLKGKMVVVGGRPETRGVVCSASYEARKVGVKSAMSCRQAWQLCPQAIFLPPRFERYQEESREIRKIFSRYTDKIEPLSLDEAYLDVTHHQSASLIAKEIQRVIYDERQLSASAGVSFNKFLAKLASDWKKPGGLTVIQPNDADAFLKDLPVRRIWGVGPTTEERLHAHNLRTTTDIRNSNLEKLKATLGNFGETVFRLAHGIDEREVESDSVTKSIGSETTFEKDLFSIQQVEATVSELATSIAMSLEQNECLARTVSLKVRYSDFETVTRSRTEKTPFRKKETIEKLIIQFLLPSTQAGTRRIRLVGISCSQLIFDNDPIQLWFDFPESFAQ
jgi:DNA polymerase IV